MQDGSVNNIVNGRLVLSKGIGDKPSGVSNISGGKLIIPKKQDSFQDDAMQDVSNKMENAVKQDQLSYIATTPEISVTAKRVAIDEQAVRDVKAQNEYDALFRNDDMSGKQPYSMGTKYKDVFGKEHRTPSENPKDLALEQYNKDIVGATEQFTPLYSQIKQSAEGFKSGIDKLSSIDRLPSFNTDPASITRERSDRLKLTSGIMNIGFSVGNMVMPGLGLFNLTTSSASPYTKASEWLAPVSKLTNPQTEDEKNAAEILDFGAQALVLGGLHAGIKGYKGWKGSKTSTVEAGGQNFENPTQTKALTEVAGRNPIKQELRRQQQSANSESVGERPFVGSEVGDTKIKFTPEEQMVFMKQAVELRKLTDETLGLQNELGKLTEQLKTNRTKANKTAYKKLSEELENKQAMRLNIESELQAFGVFAEQRQLKGLLPERGSSTSEGLDLTGTNKPSSINFTGAKDPSGELGGTETTTTRKGQTTKQTEGIPPDRLQPVETSVHDYLVNRGLDLFKMVKADKPIDPSQLGDILRQARDKGVYDDVLNILKEEAFKRGKTLQFETALKNSIVKTVAEEVKPDVKQIGGEIKSEVKDIKTPEDFRNATTPEITNFVKKEISETEFNKIVEDATNRPENKIPVEGKTEIDMQSGAIEDAIYAKAQDIIYEKNKPISDTNAPTSNRIIKDEWVKGADDYLRSNLGNLSGNPFGNTKLYGALLTKGAYHFENGVTNIAKWSKKMIEEYGEKIRPMLNGIWNEIQSNAALKQTGIANTLSKPEKVGKLNTAVSLESKPPVAKPFEHTKMSLAESQALNTMGKYVEKQGDAGAELVNAGNKVYRESSQLASKYITLYHNSIMSLSKFPPLVKEFIKIANEGGSTKNPLVTKALDAWKTIRTELGQKATEQEMTMSYFDAKSKTFKEIPFEPIENFFPHKFDFNKLRSDKFKNQFLDNLSSKLDVPRNEAERIWNQYIRRNTINEMKNIERVRQFDLDGWREELEVIPEYIQQASRRLKEVEIFGKNYEKANELISQIDKSGGDYTSAQTLFDRWVGRDVYNRDLAEYTSKLNSWQVFNKLGLLNMLNWTQGIANPGILFGVKSTAKSMAKMIKDYPELRKYVEPSGALDNSLAAYQMDSMSSAGMGDWMLRKTGVVAQERWNRVLSANAGIDYFKSQLDALIKNPNNKRLRSEMQRKIDMLNLTKEVSIDKALKDGKFTEKELLDVGYEGARKTQFLSRPQDLPDFMSRKGLKFFTLFKSFVMQQSTLVKDAVIKETMRGNIKPLLYLATVFPALGEIANTARAIVSGDKKGMEESLLLHRQEWSKVLERYAIDLATIGSFGFAYDIAKKAAYSPEGLGGWLLGANVGDIGELAFATMMASPTGGWNFEPLAKFAARQIPVPIVKQQISNKLKEEFKDSDSGRGSRGSRGGR